ncbi:uncharacterized protein B0I36DRAFT_348832 [Microdochium trichocladiopsis]|uniref:Uncharacterized protein n=1 Tax=Microdochium trichocladiopsis TaxID=1682393 RepID=A0A9P8Y5B9_9PEZI|nr:uncharacterized protein B0I36DRAFT_348832 [Microdochium trichocladiopsis]KAH7030626.1 hypothetical protein B0I36DRAFT_348832 [Microdochium trichocladiopsis]
MVQDFSQDWEHEWDPFDAIGFPEIGRHPPSQRDFDRAVKYARFMTDPDRVREAGDAASHLPYTRDQVNEAVLYFTNGEDKLDTETWEWAFYDIIVQRQDNQYRRSWAPYTRRWASCVLQQPIIIDIGKSHKQPSTTTQVAASYSPLSPKPAATASRNLVTQTSASRTRLASTTITSPYFETPANGSRLEDQDVVMTSADGQLDLANASLQPPSRNIKAEDPFEDMFPSQSSPANGWEHRILLGFHRPQLELAGRHNTVESDNRMPDVGLARQTRCRPAPPQQVQPRGQTGSVRIPARAPLHPGPQRHCVPAGASRFFEASDPPEDQGRPGGAAQGASGLGAHTDSAAVCLIIDCIGSLEGAYYQSGGLSWDARVPNFKTAGGA